MVYVNFLLNTGFFKFCNYEYGVKGASTRVNERSFALAPIKTK